MSCQPNQTMSDTPETDKEVLAYEIKELQQKVFYSHVSSDFARRLERERDEARRFAEQYRHWSCETQQEADEEKLPWEQ